MGRDTTLRSDIDDRDASTRIHSNDAQQCKSGAGAHRNILATLRIGARRCVLASERSKLAPFHLDTTRRAKLAARWPELIAQTARRLHRSPPLRAERGRRGKRCEPSTHPRCPGEQHQLGSSETKALSCGSSAVSSFNALRGTTSYACDPSIEAEARASESYAFARGDHRRRSGNCRSSCLKLAGCVPIDSRACVSSWPG